MNESCLGFRTEWLERRGAPALQPALQPELMRHADACVGCRSWVRATLAQIRVLRELERQRAPVALSRAVELELTGSSTRRIERVLGSLLRFGAPAQLEERLRQVLGSGPSERDEEHGQRKASVLSALDVQPAPHVLERLVDEELRAPEVHTVERVAGDLERLQAPAKLESRLRSRMRRSAVARLLAGPLATLAAASLIVWLAIRQTEEPGHERPFRVIHASSLDELEPLARSLVETLSGGIGASLETPSSPSAAEEREG